MIEAKIFDRKVMLGTIVVTGSSNWNAPLLLTRARVVEPGGDSELDGSWNVHIKMEAKSQAMLGEICGINTCAVSTKTANFYSTSPTGISYLPMTLRFRPR